MMVAMRLWPFHFARIGPTLDRSFGGRDQALALVLGLGVLLAGCGKAPKAPDMPRAPVGLQERFYAPRGWTWSTLKVGDDAWRYGVSSPPIVPRGSVLILAGEDDPAEVWFETVNDLIGMGYAVWVLQGHPTAAPSEALNIMARQVIRPRAGQPLVVIADGMGANVALDALAKGAEPVDAIILQRPAVRTADRVRWLRPEQAQTVAGWAVKLRLGGLHAPEFEEPLASRADFDPKRAALTAAWLRSDPALRSRPMTWGRVEGYDRTVSRLKTPVTNPPRTPVIMADADGTLAALCARVAGCLDDPTIGRAGQMQRDAVRVGWLARVVSLLERYRTPGPDAA